MQKYQNTVTDRAGNALQGATVRVYAAGTETLSTIYSDDGITQINQSTSPLETDANGYFEFYADGGDYDVIATIGSYSVEWTDIRVGFTDAELDTYTPAGTGSVETTIKDQLRNFPVVSNYGTAAQAVTACSGGRLFIANGESVTLNVPSEFATIAAAFTAIREWIIADGGTVTIQVADGTYSVSTSTSLNHQFGSQIRVVGNETTPASCVLDFGTSTVDAFVVSDGNKLGYLNGFKIKKDAKAVVGKWNSSDGADDIDNSTAVLANKGATIICGEDIVTENFYYGIAAREGSFIYAPLAQVSGAGDVGIWAFAGSTIYCPGASSSNAKDVSVTSTGTNALGFGIQAEYGSTVNCPAQGATNTTATGNHVAGIAALSGSVVRAYDAVSHTNTGHGLLAKGGGTIIAHGADLYSNTGYGWYTEDLSVVQGSSITFSVANTAGNSIGNRVAAQASGDLRIDVLDGSRIYFNTSGGAQTSIKHVANAVNRVELSGSAVNGVPAVEAVGSDTDIDLTVRGSGTGSVFLGSSQTNYVRINGASSGNVPAIYPEGQDHINLLISGKGTGVPITPTSTTSRASFRIPHGTAPSSPVNGDMWTTTAGLYVQINGSTVGPLT